MDKSNAQYQRSKQNTGKKNKTQPGSKHNYIGDMDTTEGRSKHDAQNCKK